MNKLKANLADNKIDVIEMQVSRPPEDNDSAWTLAGEQFLYCDDIVYQGVGTVWELALELTNKPVWFFWWD